MENKQRAVERELRDLIQKYNVLYKSQIYEYFAKDGREQFVGRALKALEKEREILHKPGIKTGSDQRRIL